MQNLSKAVVTHNCEEKDDKTQVYVFFIFLI